MPLARDIRRGRILQRRAQAKRNAEAEAEEQARQAALPGGVKMERTGAPENKMLSEVAQEDKVLRILRRLPFFASEQAEQLATKGGLEGSDFEGRTYSGRSGFNAADVRAIIAEKGK